MTYEFDLSHFKEAFLAFHKDQPKMQKYMKAYCIGRLSVEEEPCVQSIEKLKSRDDQIKEDFAQLRKTATDMVGL
jgi:hypothetical protein